MAQEDVFKKLVSHLYSRQVIFMMGWEPYMITVRTVWN